MLVRLLYASQPGCNLMKVGTLLVLFFISPKLQKMFPEVFEQFLCLYLVLLLSKWSLFYRHSASWRETVIETESFYIGFRAESDSPLFTFKLPVYHRADSDTPISKINFLNSVYHTQFFF